jgi:glycosyltransferase involved in cell wall biosynthesis
MEIYNNNGVLLYPPLFDGFGKVFLEAMDRGLCVIATKTGGMRDIIDDGRNGFLVEFDNPGQIVDRILYLLENSTNGRDISQAAVETAARYSWDRVAEETVSFYEKLHKIKM